MKKSNYIKEVENRYGFKITNIFTCEDQFENNYNLPDQLIFKWGVIPPDDVTERIVGGGYSKDLLSQIENSNDIYKLTNSGFTILSKYRQKFGIPIAEGVVSNF